MHQRKEVIYLASKRRIRRRSCEGKERYADAASAEAATRSLVRRFGRHHWNAYHCQFCGGWHVGRMNRRQIQAMRAKKK